MKYFLDTEFHERPHTIELISIGVVAEDGRQFYCESTDYDLSTASDWLKENVLPSLWCTKDPSETSWGPSSEIAGGYLPRHEIGKQLKKFVGSDTPEFWGYYADYDWVVTCWLFGSMIDLPKSWPMYCRDLKQLCDSAGNPKLPSQSSTEHNALNDAHWNREACNMLSLLEPWT